MKGYFVAHQWMEPDVNVSIITHIYAGRRRIRRKQRGKKKMKMQIEE